VTTDRLIIDINNDIDWLKASQPLMRHSNIHFFNTHQPLTQNTQSLVAYGKPPIFRLGHLFEEVVDRFISLTSKLETVARNIQIRNGKTTLGELDFLYRNCIDGSITHLEVAVKFYLFCPDDACLNEALPIPSLAKFIGPGSKDRLDKKWSRLTNHQLQLTANPVTQAALTALDLPLPHKSELLLTGILFYPYQADRFDLIKQHVGLEELIHPNHQYGWWLPTKEIDQIKTQALNEHWQFLLLPKHHWIAGASHYDAQEIEDKSLSFTALKAMIDKRHIALPIMIACVQKHKDGFKAVARGFIVEDNWPHTPSGSNKQTDQNSKNLST